MESTTEYKKDFLCGSCGCKWEAKSPMIVSRTDIYGETKETVKDFCPDCGEPSEIKKEISKVYSNRPVQPPLAKEYYPGTNKTVIRRFRANEVQKRDF